MYFWENLLGTREFTAPLNHVRWPLLKSASKFNWDRCERWFYMFLLQVQFKFPKMRAVYLSPPRRSSFWKNIFSEINDAPMMLIPREFDSITVSEHIIFWKKIFFKKKIFFHEKGKRASFLETWIAPVIRGQLFHRLEGWSNEPKKCLDQNT